MENVITINDSYSFRLFKELKETINDNNNNNGMKKKKKNKKKKKKE